MKAHYLKLWEYNTWANELFLQVMEDKPVINNRIFLLMSHMLVAQQVWFDRVQAVAPPLDQLWETYPLDRLKQLHKQTAQDWKQYLENATLFSLNQEIAYKTSQGIEYSTPVNDIVSHLVNHGTYHRGQIASFLKQERVEPPASDYVAYLRARQPARE